MAVSTIASHLEKLILDGEDVSVDSFVDPEKQQRDHADVKRTGHADAESGKGRNWETKYSYEEIRLVRAKVILKVKRKAHFRLMKPCFYSITL